MDNLIDELRKIASELRDSGEDLDIGDLDVVASKKKASDFDPKSIAKKENIGVKVEQSIKNKANYEWYSNFKAKERKPETLNNKMSFKQLADELRSIAKEANFNPETIGKKENSGKNIEDKIKNKATFDWLGEFKSQQGKVNVPEEWKPESYDAVERHVKKVYKNQDKNSDFYPKVPEGVKSAGVIRLRKKQ